MAEFAKVLQAAFLSLPGLGNRIKIRDVMGSGAMRLPVLSGHLSAVVLNRLRTLAKQR